MTARPYRATVEGATDLAPTVRGFTLRLDPLEHDAPFAFQAGQFVQLLLPIGEKSAESPDGLVSRDYSIASPPDGNRVELAVTRVPGGEGSTYLADLRGGETLRANGPHGFFTVGWPMERDAIFVGTGTGVAPLRAQIRDAFRRGTDRRLTLVEGVRTEADLLWGAEFERLAREHANFRFLPTLSRPTPAWTGLRGYVQLRVRELVARGADVDVYVCGLSRMTEDVRHLLRQELGLPRQRVHTERYD